jgi:hypothetical protein
MNISKISEQKNLDAKMQILYNFLTNILHALRIGTCWYYKRIQEISIKNL